MLVPDIMVKAAALLVVSTMLAGCSGSSPLPTAPSAAGGQTSAATQQGAIQLRGFMMDTAYRALAGVRVEVLDGPSAGMFATSNDNGELTLSGVFDKATRFRATKEGHESRTQTWNCSVAECLAAGNAQPWLGFYLTRLESAVDLAGAYVLRFTADGECAASLPEIARSRSYRVAVAAMPVAGRSTVPGFDVQISGVPLVGTLTGFPIGVAGNYLGFWLHGRHDPAIVEDLGANQYLAFSGNASLTLTGGNTSTIEAEFDGWIEHVSLAAPLGSWYFPLPPAVSTATCDSSHHRITLTRTN